MAGVVGALVLAIIASAAWNLPSRWFAGARPVPRLSIVVLPFANLGGDPGRQYFADGLTEDLTTDLSRLADMLVISRDTAFTYKEKPVNAKRIGHELGVRYVLEGSVQRSANQVRINAQLIDAESDRGVFGLCCLDGPPHPGAFIREKILDEIGLFGSRSCAGAGRAPHHHDRPSQRQPGLRRKGLADREAVRLGVVDAGVAEWRQELGREGP